MKVSVSSAMLCILLLLVLCFAVPDGQILWEAGDALYTGVELAPLTLDIKPFGAGLAVSAVLAWAVAFALSHRKLPMQKALCWLACALALGIILSRLLYCLIETAYYNPKWLSRMAALRIWDGGMAITGAIWGILLAGKIVPEGKSLTPVAAPLFLAGARFSETFTQLGYGPSVYFEGFLSMQVGYATRLNVSLLESAAALVIFACILLLPRHCARQKLTLHDEHRIYAFVILYGISQLFMESLRKDRHMVWGFVKVQQILAILLVVGALLLLSKSRREKRRALLISLCAVLPLIGLEFALDRVDMSIFLLYGVYLTILGAYLIAAYRIFRKTLMPAAE